MSTKKTLSRSAAALLIIVCTVCIFYMLRGDRGETAENSAAIREAYAGYALTFSADAPYQSLDELLEATDYTEVTADRYVFKDYDTEAFVPYLPKAKHISAVQTSPLDRKGETIYIIFSTEEGEEFCQCYRNNSLLTQTVYVSAEDCAYEIDKRSVKVHKNFSEQGEKDSSLLSFTDLFT
ncbi:MAG: hypothetical protein IKM54_06550 [Butyricicoccus sp.]|nr:hypothetical protein [Butyricicoccus sp.]